MAITVTCPHCNTALRVKDELAGKRGKCPRCKETVEVPAPDIPADSAAPGLIVLPDDAPVVAAVASVAAGGASGTSKAAEAPVRPPKRAAAATADAEGLVLHPDAQPKPAKPDDLSPEQVRKVRETVLGAFQARIEPVDVPLSYRLGIVLVALVMVLLPVIYVGLIVAVGYLVYLHAIHDTAILSAAGSGRGAFLALLVYLAPMVAGGIMVLFMIKPLFARPAQQGRTRSLTRDGEPLLFAFVDRVCEAVGAARPRRIDVDCQVNASASFRRGLLSMLGNDLVLTIGMPLVAGLNLRQFAGVLGHEFGHFAQGAGMRMTYVIRSISWWFTRVVYERDAWDEQLNELAKGLDLRISWVLHLARLMVWLTRKILWVFMVVGHAVGGIMLRQMEFDADRHEARLAGSDTFESTARQLLILNVAMQGAQADLGEFYREGRLGDDLPWLVMANVGQIPEKVHQQLDEHIAKSTTGWFDTHPADKDRIASARRENAPGVFRMTEPARLLFANYDALCHNSTWDYYRGIFGPQFKQTDMHPTDDLLRRQERELEAGKAVARYFQGSFTSLRPLPLPSEVLSAPAKPGACAAELREARQEMLDAKASFDMAYEQYHKADTHVLEAEQAAVLLKANFRLAPSAFSIPMTDRNGAAKVRREALALQNQLAAEMGVMDKAAVRRLVAALRLLFVPKVAQRIENVEQVRDQCCRAYSALVLLNRNHHSLLEMRNAHAALTILLNNVQENQQNESLFNSIRAQSEKVVSFIRTIYDSLQSHAYPLDHAKGEITLAQYALDKVPMADNLGGVYSATEDILQKVPPLYVRLCGRLVLAAEQVEHLLGLPALPDPEEKEDESETEQAEA